MQRIVLWLASTVTIVVLLFGYHTSTNQPPATASTSSSTTTSGGSTPSSSTPSPSTSSSGSPPSPQSSPTTETSPSTKSTVTYEGSVAQTRWGPVQVEITVAGDAITEVAVLQQPNGNHKDVEINDYALPILIQDTLDAQTADIDMVSGATVTSEGYVTSLQAALDEAGR